jgi:hypothetical protein
MPREGFEPTISVFELLKTVRVLDCAANGTGLCFSVKIWREFETIHNIFTYFAIYIQVEYLTVSRMSTMTYFHTNLMDFNDIWNERSVLNSVWKKA